VREFVQQNIRRRSSGHCAASAGNNTTGRSHPHVSGMTWSDDCSKINRPVETEVFSHVSLQQTRPVANLPARRAFLDILPSELARSPN